MRRLQSMQSRGMLASSRACRRHAMTELRVNFGGLPTYLILVNPNQSLTLGWSMAVASLLEYVIRFLVVTINNDRTFCACIAIYI